MTDMFDFTTPDETHKPILPIVKSCSFGGADGPVEGAQAWPVKWVGPVENSVTHNPAFESWAAHSHQTTDPGDVFFG